MLVNWRTTIPGLVTAVINLVVLFGIDLNVEQTTGLVTVFTTIGLLIVSFFAKDSNVTGGTKANRIK